MAIRKLELLAPAKNRDIGMAAISHGADAVYIGARHFGARVAAGNSTQEIGELVSYAHRYHARVYAAMNTILYDHELEAARDLICELWNAGVDALIIQDMGILEMDLPPLPLFASTQCDNRTWEKVKFLEDSGFDRVILARELGLEEIRTIRENTRVDLEAFVNGALCVGYSGQCYLSAAIGGRSSNRGSCGQPCRLAWSLTDEKGRGLARESHFLSLKDMNRSDYLEDLVDAGITSFKIEGRLKDPAYVKNITAFYRKRLDGLMEGQSGRKYRPASSGKTLHFFEPDPRKTFYRSQTDYFLLGSGPERKKQIFQLDTPKSMGEEMGKVKRVEADSFALNRPHDIVSGDGLCFKDKEGRLDGFYVGGSDQGKIIPSGRVSLKKRLSLGTTIYRNHDHRFLKLLDGISAERRMGLVMKFFPTPEGFCLEGRDEDGIEARVKLAVEKVAAKNESMARATLEKQLGKLGGSLFFLEHLEIGDVSWFLPVKDLNRIRRDLVQALTETRQEGYVRSRPKAERKIVPHFQKHLDFTANVANRLAIRFYKKRGVEQIESAFELGVPDPGSGEQAASPKRVMVTRHCIRNALGQCPRTKGEKGTKESVRPLFIENGKGRFELRFQCSRCEMEVWTCPG